MEFYLQGMLQAKTCTLQYKYKVTLHSYSYTPINLKQFAIVINLLRYTSPILI
jgi:hypothetical protein